jgi:hypothetical protein
MSQNIKRGRRCLKNRELLRGVTADFLSHLIREDRLAGFADRVQGHTDSFLSGTIGQQNCDRIAGNIAMLAAALYEFGLYLGDAWPNWETDIEKFIEHDLMEIRDRMLGTVAGEQASTIFIEVLRDLLGTGVVRLDDERHEHRNRLRTDKNDDNRVLVGKRFRAGYIGIVMGAAIAEVQETLRRQGRPPLAISHGALLDQLCAAEVLLDNDGKIMTTDHKGVKSFQRRFQGEGQTRVTLFRSQVLQPGEGVMKDEEDEDIVVVK